MKRLLPSPWLSVGLFGGWLLLSRSLGAGTLLLGVLVAVVLPLLFTSLRPTPRPLRNPLTLVRLILRVGRDVLVSAVDVAAGIVRSRGKPPKGTFVRVPLELRDPHALAALAMISAVIPGTVWTELSGDGSALLVHVFDLDDEVEFIAHFKRDYERPLKEIFE
jgi:multicomponent K+:H+ antiporter subunit E